ncbi:hypothetical protein CY34DRAFT_561934 [Suillus luteus UH-Slu-Lm8-n1]|uniref:Uncharacterized protein n=1 Tax=Suillus luteus UH-Slu-Lm8-n1 TaxID=930992 RepID=A0A0C9ZDW2_9AGAM|nr:hypothetical protein CY34DRAFT_561934 [Suillus luteus UH-Slu-Lm8-n1]
MNPCAIDTFRPRCRVPGRKSSRASIILTSTRAATCCPSRCYGLHYTHIAITVRNRSSNPQPRLLPERHDPSPRPSYLKLGFRHIRLHIQRPHCGSRTLIVHGLPTNKIRYSRRQHEDQKHVKDTTTARK